MLRYYYVEQKDRYMFMITKVVFINHLTEKVKSGLHQLFHFLKLSMTMTLTLLRFLKLLQNKFQMV